MSANLHTTVYNWLREMKIPVSKTYLKQQLLSHPDYPSLLSITDTLDELGLGNAALVVDKEKLNITPVPCLAHVEVKGGEFILVKDIEKFLKEYPDFEEKWNRVIVAAEKPENFANSENEKWLAKEKRQTQFFWLTLVSVAFIAAFSF